VANGAIRSGVAGDMIKRVLRIIIVALMARVAIGARLAVNRAGLMAVTAGVPIMPAQEREAGRMLEGRQIARP